MTTEAEQLANELTEAVECFPEPTRLESAAAALLRSQAAEIERLKAEVNTCGSGAGCCAQAVALGCKPPDSDARLNITPTR